MIDHYSQVVDFLDPELEPYRVLQDDDLIKSCRHYMVGTPFYTPRGLSLIGGSHTPSSRGMDKLALRLAFDKVGAVQETRTRFYKGDANCIKLGGRRMRRFRRIIYRQRD